MQISLGLHHMKLPASRFFRGSSHNSPSEELVTRSTSEVPRRTLMNCASPRLSASAACAAPKKAAWDSASSFQVLRSSSVKSMRANATHAMATNADTLLIKVAKAPLDALWSDEYTVFASIRPALHRARQFSSMSSHTFLLQLLELWELWGIMGELWNYVELWNYGDTIRNRRFRNEWRAMGW